MGREIKTIPPGRAMPIKTLRDDDFAVLLTDKSIYVVGPSELQNSLMASFLNQTTGAKCLVVENLGKQQKGKGFRAKERFARGPRGLREEIGERWKALRQAQDRLKTAGRRQKTVDRIQ